MTPAAIAVDYYKRGLCPVEIPRGQKAPTKLGWQDHQWESEGQVAGTFTDNSNIGINLGDASGGLIDVDLDHPLAVELAAIYLPPTGAKFGRASKPNSHYLYRVTSEVATKKFKTPKVDGRKTIVELRSKGCQTVFPGSVHPSGEAIEWDSDGEPATVDPEVLLAQLQALSDEVYRRLGVSPENGSAKGSGNNYHSTNNPSIIERARKYLAKIPPAISGSGGHDQTFHGACVLVQGFALERDAALSLLTEWNQMCAPPWSDRELEHKVDEAIKQPGERGYLLATINASGNEIR